jgi:iron(III) transport system substrate-binding protein
MMTKKALALASALWALSALPSLAQDGNTINLYNARHYGTDQALFDDFTKATGIKINRVNTDDAGVVTRLKAEGASSPADVILMVDAARLVRAEQDGLFQPVKSKVLDDAIVPSLKGTTTADGTLWFGFSTRARVIVYNKANVKREDVDTYAELADPKNKGKVCTRSGSHPYNLSLWGSVMERIGEAQTESLLKGVVANMARDPRGGDTDQIMAVASGECGIAVSNTYYMARLMKSEKPEDKAAVEKVGVIFPDQAGAGTHMNIAGGAVAKYSKNREAAVKFLEYLASQSAQDHFANGNNEWPTIKGYQVKNAALSAMMGPTGQFKQETISIAKIAANTTKVQQMLDRAGYK